jgi:hypothetical protein
VRDAWDALRERSPQRSVYADPGFAEATAEAHGWPVSLACVWEEERLRAGCIVYAKRRGPYRAAALPPLARFSSPLLDGPLVATSVHHRSSPLDALLDVLAGHFQQTSLVLHPSLVDVRPLHWRGWKVQPAYTYCLDLGDASPVDSWSASPRRVLRQSRDAFALQEEHEVGDVIALVEASHERQEKALGVSARQAAAIASRLVRAGMARVFVARTGGTAEAGVIVLTDGREAHYWLAGSRPGAAMTVLLAYLLEQLRAEGVTRFDFAGANTPSIAEFKRRFGPVLVPYFRARLVTRPELRLIDALRPRF